MSKVSKESFPPRFCKTIFGFLLYNLTNKTISGIHINLTIRWGYVIKDNEDILYVIIKITQCYKIIIFKYNFDETYSEICINSKFTPTPDFEGIGNFEYAKNLLFDYRSC